MNAATRTANQMPTMVSTLLLLGLGGIGCFPRKDLFPSKNVRFYKQLKRSSWRKPGAFMPGLAHLDLSLGVARRSGGRAVGRCVA
jgi:hypothetical protein